MLKHLRFTLLASALFTASATAQDLTVSRIAGSPGSDINYYGESSGMRAYSFGTTSCNVGDVAITWLGSGQDQHPVISQNMYRIQDGRFEQLGYSFLKHGFCAVNENSCGSCQGTPCSSLGIGCADTYGAGLNDGAGGRTKSQVNPVTGAHVDPNTGPSGSDGTIRGRLQVPAAAMGLPGATYFIESTYIDEIDQLAGNGRNNISWRQISTSQGSGSISGSGFATNIGDPALYAWQVADPSVMIDEVVNSDEGGTDVHGYYFVGSNAVDLGGGMFRYEYAVMNMNSAQGTRTFSVDVPCATVDVSSLYFNDVDYHSGDPYSSVDWTGGRNGGTVTWSTDDHGTNPNANALRWGEVNTFSFIADAPPAMTNASMSLFAPGTGSVLNAEVIGPCGSPVCGGFTYCATSANSVGAGATMDFSGSTNVSANDLMLFAAGAPSSVSGLFYYGPNMTQLPFGDGERCIGGQTQRLPVQQSNIFGDFELAIDFTAAPFSAGPTSLMAGSITNFQLWYRDTNGPGGTGFNLSDALNFVLCP